MIQASSHAGSVCKLRLRSDRGQATIEFALVIIFLMIVLADSAKEGVRYAIVHGTNNSTPSGPTCPCKDIDGPAAPPGTVPGYNSSYGVVKTFAQYSLHDTSGMTVTVTYPAGNKTPNLVQVVVAYPYQPFFGLGWPTITVNAAAEGRIIN